MSEPVDKTIIERQIFFKPSHTRALIFCVTEFDGVVPDRQATVDFVDQNINTNKLIDVYRT